MSKTHSMFSTSQISMQNTHCIVHAFSPSTQTGKLDAHYILRLLYDSNLFTLTF